MVFRTVPTFPGKFKSTLRYSMIKAATSGATICPINDAQFFFGSFILYTLWSSTLILSYLHKKQSNLFLPSGTARSSPIFESNPVTIAEVSFRDLRDLGVNTGLLISKGVYLILLKTSKDFSRISPNLGFEQSVTLMY